MELTSLHVLASQIDPKLSIVFGIASPAFYIRVSIPET